MIRSILTLAAVMATKIGFNHWGGLYQINPRNDQLRDGAQFLQHIGSPIKIYLGVHAKYSGIQEELIKFHDGRIQLHPSATYVLENYDTIALVVFCPDRYENYWNGQFAEEDRSREVKFFSALTEYLYKHYGDQDKTIFFQNSESDDAIRKILDENNVHRFKQWIRARMTGVSDVRSKQDSKLKVLCGMEVNKVLGGPGVVDHISDLQMDFVSYSFYEWKIADISEGVANLRAGIEKIQKEFQCITKEGLEALGERKCYIGEFGAGNQSVDVTFAPAVKELLGEMGVRYGFFWNLFNNEKGKQFHLVSESLALSPVIKVLF